MLIFVQAIPKESGTPIKSVDMMTLRQKAFSITLKCQDAAELAAKMGLKEHAATIRSVELDVLRQIAAGLFDKDD